MIQKLWILVFIVILLFAGCQSDNNSTGGATTYTSIIKEPVQTLDTKTSTIRYLALGDSYTIGQNVCETCKFPEQLKNKLFDLNNQNTFFLNIIAKTGWTTTNLISAINNQNPSADYDLVTLLIGVNNQYQGNSFSIYEKELPELVRKATLLAKGNKTNVIVISIPDYAYTPYGNGNKTITTEIDRYNIFAQNYCTQNNISFINITDITRQGLLDPSLVASDNLHPSDKAYGLFVNRILPKAIAAVLQK
ncbi:SGNH/GDSL hydrolase family protein [Flavobacterium taihuense]|uniref:SGNH/GDSL hydrolase family protein n=1 Tax=Flavobacterium taihuense TaxID=2857508 RepID=A0ABS6XS58_9FLAO|nr:SGNH/GDSL hydrolase family protein [Flavobacterium taihuense]MBW4359197.1 SGNH/GDSL hydrolase family protein [Flavobacterium taihuense]